MIFPSHSERLVRSLARKKIVFVIVEGASESDALGVLLTRIYDKNMVQIHILHRDLTTERGANPSNIIAKVGNEIRGFAASSHYTKKDFKEIIHITDTDGAYIPAEQVKEDPEAVRPIYSTKEIRTANREGILLRNQRKSENLDKLCSCSSVWSVPYGIYYMSCNLDHVLYDRLNCTDEEKERNAHQFAKEYRENIDGFLQFITGPEISGGEDYRESWEFIRAEGRSLERYTNLGIGLVEGRGGESRAEGWKIGLK